MRLVLITLKQINRITKQYDSLVLEENNMNLILEEISPIFEEVNDKYDNFTDRLNQLKKNQLNFKEIIEKLDKISSNQSKISKIWKSKSLVNVEFNQMSEAMFSALQDFSNQSNGQKSHNQILNRMKNSRKSIFQHDIANKRRWEMDSKMKSLKKNKLKLESIKVQVQTEKTRIMLDLESQIENMYSAMVKQFSFIILYFNISTFATISAFITNLIMLLYMFECYSKHLKRTISLRVTSIGTWKKVLNTTSLIAIFFNSFILLFPARDSTIKIMELFSLPSREKEYQFVGLLVFIFLFVRYLINLLISNNYQWVTIAKQRMEYSEIHFREGGHKFYWDIDDNIKFKFL